MYHLRRLFIAVTILASFLQTQGASKYYNDENRPYEFGFNIDGMQHRHEKKDENGLIQGEFGFITADGVYHVTVYATDENGGFKILSMKNIRVHPYPTSGVKQGHSLKLPPQDANHPPPPPPPQSQPVAPIKLEPPVKSCSHCSIPTTSTVAPKLNDIASISQEQQPPFENNYQNNPQYPANNPQYPENNPSQHPSSNPQYSPNNPQYPSNNPEYSPNDSQNPSNNAQNPNQEIDIHSRFPEYPQENDIPHNQNEINNNYPKPQRNPKQFDNHNYAQPGFAPQNEPPQYPQNNDPAQKPVLINAQMQIVDRNTDINHLNPNERPGLPNGLHKGDMETLLYTFNYTVGFHGHHEEGYTNGAKKGYYFITGRNGIRTRVDYVADETGFHPKISQEVLDVLSDEVPKPETEKDEKYGLKGYEFKWLYYPENSKK